MRRKCARNYKQQNVQETEYYREKLYEGELVKSENEHREPIIVGFFILQYAKLRKLELFYNFFDKHCDINKFEMLEMDTDSFILAVVEEEI